jgi:hypothetical protein
VNELLPPSNFGMGDENGIFCLILHTSKKETNKLQKIIVRRKKIK